MLLTSTGSQKSKRNGSFLAWTGRLPKSRARMKFGWVGLLWTSSCGQLGQQDRWHCRPCWCCQDGRLTWYLIWWDWQSHRCCQDGCRTWLLQCCHGGLFSNMQDFILYNWLTGVCLDWRGMAGGHARLPLRHDGHVVMIFCCFLWLAWKKSDNATLEKQFRKRSNRQNFHNSFSVQNLIKVQTNITTRNNGTMNSQ